MTAMVRSSALHGGAHMRPDDAGFAPSEAALPDAILAAV